MKKTSSHWIWINVFLTFFLPQTIQAGWFRSYGGDGYDCGRYLLELDDGSFIVLGETASQGAGETDIWLLKVNTEGDTAWSKTYGGSSDEIALCIQPMADSGFIILAETNSIDSGGVWLIRIDSQGEVLWNRTYGGGYMYPGSPLLKVGEDQTITFTDNERFMKINSAGGVILTKTYEEHWGEYYDIYCANSTSDGQFILCSNEFVKVDEDGEIIRTLSEFYLMVDAMYYIDEGHWGYVYVGLGKGMGSDSIANSDLSAAEVDTIDGDPLWGTCYDWPVTNEFGYCIKPTPDSGYIVAGDPCTLLKLGDYDEYTQSIEHEWMRDYDCTAYYVELTSDGGYIVVGEKDEDLFLVKTDSLGLLGIEEPVTPPVTPVTHHPDLSVPVSVSRQIVLQYSNCPQGFSVSVFDASGRKVDQLHSASSSGTLSWGDGHGPGVYFIRLEGDNSQAQKIILFK